MSAWFPFSLGFLSNLIFSPLLAVGETATSKPGSPQQTQVLAAKLPICFDKEETLEEIKATQKANKKTDYKYKGYIQLFDKSGISDEEIMTRLVYAETLASSCPKSYEEVLRIVAEVIHRRVERSDNDIKKVVFARDQFASSLNIYSESAYREFLCPKNLEVWNQVQRKVSEILGNKKRNDSPKGANNYYFFQHSSRFSPPKWTETLTSYAEVKSEGQLCMKAYIGK